MQIDWFTFIAQIINFLVLMWLLKRFLYGPIVNHMDERARKLEQHQEDVKRKEEEAQQAKEQYEALKKELSEQHQQILDESKKEAEIYRKERLESARDEIQTLKQDWLSAFQNEKKNRFQQFYQQLAQQTLTIVRQVLKHLAHHDLEQDVINEFLSRLKKTTEEGIHSQLKVMEKMTVESSFPIDPAHREKIASQLHEITGQKPTIDFVETSDLICGIRLKTAGYKIGWNMAEYLEGLETTFHHSLTSESSEKDSKSPNEAETHDLIHP